MRSVFDGSFLSNLQRISYGGVSSRVSKATASADSAAFEQVLHDLIRPSNAENTNGLEAHSPKTQSKASSWNTSDLLSNLPLATSPTLGESVLSRNKEEGPSLLPAKDVIVNPQNQTIVKESALGVKSVEVAGPTLKNEGAETVIRSVTSLRSQKSAAETLSHADVKQLISKAGNYHGVDSFLGIAVAETESNFNPSAVSSDGYASKGLFQLLDSTGEELHQNFAVGQPYDPFNPRLNAYLGVGYIKQLMEYFSKETVLNGGLKTTPAKSTAEMEKLAVAAFNAGIGNVARAQRRAKSIGLNPTQYDNIKQFLPQITRRYVNQVVRRRQQLAASAIPDSVG